MCCECLDETASGLMSRRVAERPQNQTKMCFNEREEKNRVVSFSRLFTGTSC